MKVSITKEITEKKSFTAFASGTSYTEDCFIIWRSEEIAKFIGISTKELSSAIRSGKLPREHGKAIQVTYENALIYKHDPYYFLRKRKRELIEQNILGKKDVPKKLHFVKELIKVPVDEVVRKEWIVYFLCYQKEVVYVGKSSNLLSRLGSHKKDKVFDEVYCIEVKAENVDEIENHYIDKFMPKYNGKKYSSYAKSEYRLTI